MRYDCKELNQDFIHIRRNYFRARYTEFLKSVGLFQASMFASNDRCSALAQTNGTSLIMLLLIVNRCH